MPRSRSSASLSQSDTLADILERVLETGIVVAGDIKVNLNNVELLTIQIRLIVCSVDKAQEMGLDWWRHADYLTSAHGRRLAEAQAGAQASASEGASDSSSAEATLAETIQALDARLARMEQRLADQDAPSASGSPDDTA